jgi:hypothetical protein
MPPCPTRTFVRRTPVRYATSSLARPGPGPYPPATPQGGSPAPTSHYSFPYFLGFAMSVWDRAVWCPFSLRGVQVKVKVNCLPPSAALSGLWSLGCDFAVRLVASGALIRVRATFPPVGGPTPYQLPDLDDVHSCFLFTVPTFDLRSSTFHTTVGCSGNEGRSPFPATRSPTLPTEGATTASTT